MRVAKCLFLGAIILISVIANAQSHNVNCREQYQFSRAKVDISADVLKKISGELKLDPQLLAQVDKWTTVVLAQESAVCNAYKKSTEAQFPTTRYLDELDKLRQWDETFLQMVLTYVSACEAKTTKGAVTQNTKQLKTTAERLITHLPKLEVPSTARH